MRRLWFDISQGDGEKYGQSQQPREPAHAALPRFGLADDLQNQLALIRLLRGDAGFVPHHFGLLYTTRSSFV